MQRALELLSARPAPERPRRRPGGPRRRSPPAPSAPSGRGTPPSRRRTPRRPPGTAPRAGHGWPSSDARTSARRNRPPRDRAVAARRSRSQRGLGRGIDDDAAALVERRSGNARESLVRPPRRLGGVEARGRAPRWRVPGAPGRAATSAPRRMRAPPTRAGGRAPVASVDLPLPESPETTSNTGGRSSLAASQATPKARRAIRAASARSRRGDLRLLGPEALHLPPDARPVADVERQQLPQREHPPSARRSAGRTPRRGPAASAGGGPSPGMPRPRRRREQRSRALKSRQSKIASGSMKQTDDVRRSPWPSRMRCAATRASSSGRRRTDQAADHRAEKPVLERGERLAEERRHLVEVLVPEGLHCPGVPNAATCGPAVRAGVERDEHVRDLLHHLPVSAPTSSSRSIIRSRGAAASAPRTRRPRRHHRPRGDLARRDDRHDARGRGPG